MLQFWCNKPLLHRRSEVTKKRTKVSSNPGILILILFQSVFMHSSNAQNYTSWLHFYNRHNKAVIVRHNKAVHSAIKQSTLLVLSHRHEFTEQWMGEYVAGRVDLLD